MDVWPWLVRHAGWLLERYHVKGNKQTTFEDCFGKPYQGEVKKFGKAALFRLVVSPSGRVRSEMWQCRADARFVRSKWLGKTTESDEHLFATDTGVYTTRTVTRVPDTEPRRADLVKSLQGTPRDGLAGRPAGRPCKTAPQAPPVATLPVAEASEQPSEDASERCSAKAQDLTPPVVPHVLPFPRAADSESEPSSASGPVDGALEWIQPVAITRRSHRRLRLRAVQMTERIRVASGVCNQQVNLNYLMRTSNEASCNKLKGSQHMMQKRSPWLARRKSSSRWKHSESSMCAKNCRKMRRSSQRDGIQFQKVTSGDAGS